MVSADCETTSEIVPPPVPCPPLDPRQLAPLPDTKIPGYLITKRSSLGTLIIGRRLGVRRCRRNLGEFFRADQAAFDVDRHQADIGGPLQMARHYSPSGSKT